MRIFHRVSGGVSITEAAVATVVTVVNISLPSLEYTFYLYIIMIPDDTESIRDKNYSVQLRNI